MDRSKSTKLTLLFLVFISLSLFVVPKPTKRYRYDADFLDSEIQRIRSGRAEEIEPVWTVTKSSTTIAPIAIVAPTEEAESKEKDNNENESENDEEEQGSSSSEDYYGSSEEIEITCASGKGWHMRGQRCVPMNCPGGPSERDFNTGECLYSYQPKGRYNKPFTQSWNDMNHVYRSSPMSSHFVRSMILMRKG